MSIGEPLELSRERVLAHRAVVQDPATPARNAVDSRTLGLGLQNTPPGSGLTGLNARAAQPPQAVTGIHLTGVARAAEVAAWLGCPTGNIKATWDLIAKDLTACSVAGTRRWALTSDVESLSTARRPGGAKLLPPSDPYLLGDRSLVAPDRDHQRRLWRAQGSPGQSSPRARSSGRGGIS